MSAHLQTVAARPTLAVAAFGFALLFAAGVGEAVLVYFWAPGYRGQAVLHAAYAVTTVAAVFLLGRARRPLACPAWGPWAVLGGGFLLTVLLAQFAMEAFPNSGDEYGYNYIAETFLHGRLWNQPHPGPLRDVLETFYIAERDGKRVSQYPPGWPAVLAAFKLAGLSQFANAVVGLLAGGFLWLALRRVTTFPSVRLAALMLGMLAPFTLFNDASFFSHSLTAAALLAAAWLDLRDAGQPSPWNRAGIGFAFSLLLVTRYEAFLIPAALLILDGVARRRLGFVRWALPAAVAGLPVTTLFLVYNWRVTGSPFETTLHWASPTIGIGLHAMGIEGRHSAMRGLEHTGKWLESWQDFAAVVLLPLYAVALWRRVAARTVRWFDLVLPALVVFFFLYPDGGGFQYGPRYWYLGHAMLPLTIAAGLPVAGEVWQVGSWRLDPLRLATAQLASFAGFTLGYAVFLHMQTELRMLPLRVAARLSPPAVLLVRDDVERIAPWQGTGRWRLSADYTRNGVGELGPVILARDLGKARTALLCEQLPDRTIYELRMNGDASQVRDDLVCGAAK